MAVPATPDWAINFSVCRSWTSLTRACASSLLPWAETAPESTSMQIVTMAATSICIDLRLDMFTPFNPHGFRRFRDRDGPG
jgi:hypothetical protein